MGWKTRKDKLSSDQPDVETVQDPEEQEQAPEVDIESDAGTLARLAQLTADSEPSAFVLDLDKDSFRTDSKRTSLDPTEFGWFNTQNGDGAAPPRPAAPPQPTFNTPAPQFDLPAFTPQPAAEFDEPSFDIAPTPNRFGSAFEDKDPVSWDAAKAPNGIASNLDEPAPLWNESPAPAFDSPSWAKESEPFAARPEPDPAPFRQQEPAPPPAFADPGDSLKQPLNGNGSTSAAPAWNTPPSAPSSTPSWADPPAFQPAPEPPFPSTPAPSMPPMQPAQSSSPFAAPAGQAPPSPSPYAQGANAPMQPSPYATQPPRGNGDGQNINSFSRDSVAAGLVSGEGDFAIPKVAPFIVSGGMPTQEEIATSGDHYLIIRIRNLSSSYKLTKDVTTIGRPDSITKNYPDVEIELDDGVSRKHSEIRRKGGEFYVVDVGSTNGTLHNGDLMDVNVEIRLTHGDRIRVGEKTEIVFE